MILSPYFVSSMLCLSIYLSTNNSLLTGHRRHKIMNAGSNTTIRLGLLYYICLAMFLHNPFQCFYPMSVRWFFSKPHWTTTPLPPVGLDREFFRTLSLSYPLFRLPRIHSYFAVIPFHLFLNFSFSQLQKFSEDIFLSHLISQRNNFRKRSIKQNYDYNRKEIHPLDMPNLC